MVECNIIYKYMNIYMRQIYFFPIYENINENIISDSLFVIEPQAIFFFLCVCVMFQISIRNKTS